MCLACVYYLSEGIRSPEAGVTDSCELPLGARNCTVPSESPLQPLGYKVSFDSRVRNKSQSAPSPKTMKYWARQRSGAHTMESSWLVPRVQARATSLSLLICDLGTTIVIVASAFPGYSVTKMGLRGVGNTNCNGKRLCEVFFPWLPREPHSSFCFVWVNLENRIRGPTPSHLPLDSCTAPSFSISLSLSELLYSNAGSQATWPPVVSSGSSSLSLP